MGTPSTITSAATNSSISVSDRASACLLFRRALGCRRGGGLNPGLGQEGKRLREQVTFDDPAAGIAGHPFLGHMAGVNRRETELLRGLELTISRVLIVLTSRAISPHPNLVSQLI